MKKRRESQVFYLFRLQNRDIRALIGALAALAVFTGICTSVIAGPGPTPPKSASSGLKTISSFDPALAKKATVLLFLSSRCPCSNSHISTIKDLAREYTIKGYQFIAIHSNSDEKDPSDQDYFNKLNLEFPLIEDRDGKFADRYGALKTPHVFVLSKEGQVLFSGGVDDSASHTEKSVPHLLHALQDIEAGRPVKDAKVRALGCQIRRG